MLKVFCPISLFLILILPGSFCTSASEIPITLKSELEYLDTLEVIVNSWFANPDYSLDDISYKLDSTENRIKDVLGNTSLPYAFIIHKKGVVHAIAGTEDQLPEAAEYFETALNIRKERSNIPDSIIIPEIINGYYNIGLCHYDLGHPYNAISYLQKGLLVADRLPDKEPVAGLLMSVYFTCALAYYEIGNYDYALKYYDAIIYYKDNKTDASLQQILNDWKIQALIAKGSVQAWALNSPEKAITNLNKAIDMILPAKDLSARYENWMADAYHNLGIAYHTLDDFEKSRHYYNKSVSLNSKYELIPKVFNSYLNLGVLYLDYDHVNEAEEYLMKARGLLDEYAPPDTWMDIYENMGDVMFKRGDYMTSLTYDNKAIEYLIPGYKPSTVFDNPVLKGIPIPDKPRLLNLLSSKANTLLHLYYIKKDTSYLLNAYNTFLITDDVIGLMRSEFIADASKINLVSETKPVYEKAIETCWLLYQKTQKSTYLHQAFRYSEKSRAIILLDAVRKTSAKSVLPQDIIENEKELNLKTNYFEKQVALHNQNGSTSSFDVNYYDSLLFYRRNHERIIDSIKKGYPEYHAAIYNQNVSGQEEVMKFLEDDQSFIEYFTGDSNLYAFVIDKNDLGFFQIKIKDSLRYWVNEFNDKIRLRDQQFITPGYKLYTYLIASLEEKSSLSKKLIIVPDDILSYVSFDALVTKKPGAGRVYFPAFKDYLIYIHQVSYVFSASSLLETGKKSSVKLKPFLGVAPEFNKSIRIGDSGFDKLEGNKKEVRKLKRLFHVGDILTKKSSVGSFTDHASNYEIIHLATHAKADMENGDLSYILFSPGNEGKFYAKDLYALDLNSDMVILSACQTGSGSIVRGEGVISLARGFIYAGSSSVITSLWNVREKSNSEIILHFYEGIKRGKTKDQALRDAKLKYLASITRENQEMAHPFYWGSLICMGDIKSYHKEQTCPWLWIVFSLSALVIILLWLYIRSNRKKSGINA